MNFLKTVWPTPFKIEKKNTTSFIVQLIIFIVICAVVGALIGLLAKTPIIGFIFGVVGSLLGTYSLVDIVLCVLVYLDIIK